MGFLVLNNNAVKAYDAGPCESLSGTGKVECLTSEPCGDNECAPTAGSCKDGACMDNMGSPTNCEPATNKCGDVFCPSVTSDGTCFCKEDSKCMQMELPCPCKDWVFDKCMCEDKKSDAAGETAQRL